MKKTLQFAKLDFITIQPYLSLKNMLIFLVVSIILVFINGSIQGVLAMLGLLYASYPFASADKDGLDALYTSLAVSRKNVVMGRYLFTFALDFLVGIGAFIVSYLLNVILGLLGFGGSESTETVAMLFVLAITTMVIFFVQITQIPVYFKLGYNKARVLAMIPLLAIGAAIVLGYVVMMNTAAGQAVVQNLTAWLTVQNMVMALVIALVAMTVFTLVSIWLSVRFYSKRDF